MKEGVALSQLADILPPPAPGGPDWLLLLVGIGIVGVTAAVTVLWFVKRRYALRGQPPAREARRRLAALRNEWQSQAVTDREAAYRLATLLRLGLALPQLSVQRRPRAVEDETLWRETLRQLHALRYRDHSGISLSPQYFERAERWLAAAQRQGR